MAVSVIRFLTSVWTNRFFDNGTIESFAVSHARYLFNEKKIFERKVGMEVIMEGGACFFSFSLRRNAHRRLIALVPQAKARIQGFSEAFLAEIVIRDLRGRSGRIFTVSRWLLQRIR